MASYSIKGVTIVSGENVYEDGTISVDGERISSNLNNDTVFDLAGKSYLYPALINTHDHFRGNYLPRVGPSSNSYYTNWGPWDNDLKASPVYEERSNIDIEKGYFLSAYKNLFSGVGTANDHFPHEINDSYLPRLPIRVIREYCLSHECSSFDLNWGDGIEIEHKRAVENGWPYITHLEEGFDVESMDGVEILDKLHCLDDLCLFVHCIGFTDEDIKKVAKAGASVSWCPGSNKYMFNVTAKIRKMLQAGINVTLGTDSCASGSLNILEEMRFARKTYNEMYGEDLSPKELFKMTTINSAKAFKMSGKVGCLDEGAFADLLVVKAKNKDPYENFVGIQMEDIEFFSVSGIPVLAEERFAKLLPTNEVYEEVKIDGRKMFARGKPLSLYKAVRKAVGFKKVLEFFPFECD